MLEVFGQGSLRLLPHQLSASDARLALITSKATCHGVMQQGKGWWCAGLVSFSDSVWRGGLRASFCFGFRGDSLRQFVLLVCCAHMASCHVC